MVNPEINLIPTATLLEIQSSGKIPCRTWGIASESNVAFLLVHGLGGHSGWFEALARRLKVKHIFVMALDLAGFGFRNNDPRISVDEWLKDIQSVFDYLHSLMGGRPVFLLGNSMGALLALRASKSCKPSGLALLSPAFAGHPKMFPLLYQGMSLVNALLCPNKEITLPYSVEDITNDQQTRIWLEKYGNNRKAIPGKILLSLLLATQALKFEKIDLPFPLLMITAKADSVVSNQASALIFQKINSPEKKHIVIANSAHDLTLDLALDEIAELVCRWSHTVLLMGNKDKQN